MFERLSAGSATIDVVSNALQEHGAVILEGALSSSQLERLRRELSPWFECALTGEGPFFGTRTQRFSALFSKSDAMAEVALHPIALGATQSILGANCDRIELSLTQAIGIGPGEPPQFLHRDESLWPHQFPFEVMVNIMVALDDFTAINGATRIIPGSHRWERSREPLPGEAIPATAPAGSMILWLGGTLHAAGGNCSSETRRGVIVSFRLAWLAPAEKLLLSTPPDRVRALPRRLQELLGDQLHRPNLGWIEGRDPIEWLNGHVADLAAAADNLTAAHEAMLIEVERDPAQFAGYLT